MSGGRGSGFASGQYSYGVPGEGRVPVPAARNPLRIGDNVELTAASRKDAPGEFQKAAVSMMRLASGRKEGYGGATLRSVEIDLIEYRASRRKGLSQGLTHADSLAALAWKCESRGHERPCTRICPENGPKDTAIPCLSSKMARPVVGQFEI